MKERLNKILSPREFQILEFISKGIPREDIAEKMGISKLTYDSYRKNIRMKLGIKTQADWVRILSNLL